MNRDELFMREAMAEAHRARALGEVPVGAVVVHGGEVIARGHNLRERGADPTAHAEVVALRRAGQVLGGWRLAGATLYATLEPCAMCVGAAVNARVDRLVYGPQDPKAGAVDSLFDIARDPRLNHRIEVAAGVLREELSAMLRDFFVELRRSQREQAAGDTRRLRAV